MYDDSGANSPAQNLAEGFFKFLTVLGVLVMMYITVYAVIIRPLNGGKEEPLTKMLAEAFK